MYRTPGVRTSGERQRCLYCGREERPGAECFPCRILVPPEESAHHRGTVCARCALQGSPGQLVHVALGPNDAEVDHCRACEGLFVSSSAWTALLDAAYADETLDLARFLRGSSVDRLPLVRCPVCRYEMERARFGGTSNVVVDVCNQHGVWLDPMELPALVAFVRGAPVAEALSTAGQEDEVVRYLTSELLRAEIAHDLEMMNAIRARLGDHLAARRKR